MTTALINCSCGRLEEYKLFILRTLSLYILLSSLAGTVAFGADKQRISNEVIRKTVDNEVLPSWQAIPLESSEIKRVTLQVRLQGGGTVTAVEGSCGCIRTLSSLPLRIESGHTGTLELQVVGVSPGVKTVRVLTDHGPIPATLVVQIGTSSSGRTLLGKVAERIENAPYLNPWFIVHDLNGAAQNCGCSPGSLGGIEYLAALPGLWKKMSHEHPARFILTGAIEGDRPGLSMQLIQRGWEITPQDIVVGKGIDTFGTQTDWTRLHLWTSTSLPHAQRASDVWIPLDGGAVAAVALMPQRGFPDSIHYVPIDRSLDRDDQVLHQIPPSQKPVPVVVEEMTNCGSCHQGANHAWEASKHAHAWHSLNQAQRQQDCAACHSSPREHSAVREANVTCMGCHRGGAAHAQNPSITKTLGATDCRSCHDAKRVPDFDPVAAWLRIQHGR